MLGATQERTREAYLPTVFPRICCGVLPSIEGVTFSTDQDPVNGTVRIFVDPVTRPDGLKSASGGYDFVDANGPP